MKKKYLIVFLTFVALLCWWLLKVRIPEPISPSETKHPSLASDIASEVKKHLPLVLTNRNTKVPENLELLDARIQKRRSEEIEKGKDEWRAPIEFYGRIVDENENPVPDVQVDFGATDLSPTGNSNYRGTSDTNGLFSINGIKGKLLSVRIFKDGYYTSKRDNNYFEYGDPYGHFVPDANSPIVFHLRKKGQAEPLIAMDYPGFAKIAQLRRNGEPIELDLLKGQKVSSGSGQIKLEFWCDKIEKTTRMFNWRFRISVPNGGLLEVTDEFSFEAPEKGYSDFWEVEGTPEKWRAEVRNKYFIRLSDGKYGRIEFSLLARNGVFTVQSFINPSGSRNLEFDPEVQPKQTHFE